MSSLALAVPLTAITVLGVLLNLYIILVVILSKQIHTANNVLLLHLGAVDVALGVVFLVSQPPGLRRAPPCSLPGFLVSLLHPVALWTLCGLHTDRYFAISTPLHYGAKVSTRKVLLGIGMSWAGALALSVLALLPSCGTPVWGAWGTASSGALVGGGGGVGGPVGSSPATLGPWTGAPSDAPSVAESSGGGSAAGWGPLVHAGVYTTTTLLLPAAIVLACNLKVLMIARHHRHRIASAIFEVTLSAQVTITHQRNPFGSHVGGVVPSGPEGTPGNGAAAAAAAAAAKFRSRSALSPVVQLLGSLVLLYFPYYGLLMWEALFAAAGAQAVSAVSPHFSSFALFLITCSPPVNGLLYGVKNKVLRKTIQNYWRKQMSKSEMNQEIQARTPSTCGSRRPSLTPAGSGAMRPNSSTLQRRLSEIVLEPLRSSMSVGSASPKPSSKFQRIASDLAWKPIISSPLGHSLSYLDGSNGMKRSKSLKDGWHQTCTSATTASLNTLQIPTTTSNGDISGGTKRSNTTEALPERPGSVCSTGAVVPTNSANLFLQRVLGTVRGHHDLSPGSAPRHGPSVLLASVSTARRSPRILITRAFSEESDHSPPATQRGIGEILKKHSSSATTLLMDRKWKKIRYRDTEELESGPSTLSDDSSTPTHSSSEHRPLEGDADVEYAAWPCEFSDHNGIQEDADDEDLTSITSPLSSDTPDTCEPRNKTIAEVTGDAFAVRTVSPS